MPKKHGAFLLKLNGFIGLLRQAVRDMVTASGVNCPIPNSPNGLGVGVSSDMKHVVPIPAIFLRTFDSQRNRVAPAEAQGRYSSFGSVLRHG